MTFAKLSAFSLASFELNAQSGGTHRYADAVYDLDDQISLSPQAMGLIGDFISTSVPAEQESSAMGEG